MRLAPRLVVNLVTVLALGVLTVGWVLVSLVGGGAFEDPLRVTADFKASGGVFTNQEVTYRGVTVGRVGELSLNPTGVDIELLIDPDWEDRIPDGVTARVQSKSAVGEQFVNLVPDGSGDGTLQDGDVIPRERTHLPVDFQRLLASIDAVLEDLPPGRTRRVIATLGAGLGGRGDDIATILRSLGSLADAFADVAPEQQRLLTSATTTGSAFLATKDDFARAIAAADRVAAGIGDEPEELERMLAQNDRLARRGIALLSAHGADLRSGIAGLADLMSFQLRNRREVIKSLDYLPDFMEAIEDASVPWVSPEGKRFYRIRVGLVYDNVPESWPCGYRVREQYPRYPFERKEREPYTDMRCRDLDAEAASFAAGEELVATLERMASPAPVQTASLDVAGGSTGGFIWPLDGVVTSGFGPRWGRMHNGIDIDGTTGEPVYAAQDGVVAFAGRSSGYGNLVVIDHGDGLSTSYAHLDSIAVGPGASVPRGGVVGTLGCTGRCFGDHLHFEVRVHGAPVDPLAYLPGGFLFVPAVQPPEGATDDEPGETVAGGDNGSYGGSDTQGADRSP